jgi:hypothetical protein
MKEPKPKPEYTEEQLSDIKEQIIADRLREHHAIAGDQAYRLACMYIARDVQNGIYDQSVLATMGDEWERFKKENPILGKKDVVKLVEDKK